MEEETKKEQKTRKGLLVIFGIIAFITMLIIITAGGSNSEKPVLTEEEQRLETIERQFSAWDGSHRGVTASIKASMNDPKSYEHIKTVFGDRGEYLIVETTFRGKNAFGGLVINTVRAKVSLSGEIIEILLQE